jgi:hypothetical protein
VSDPVAAHDGVFFVIPGGIDQPGDVAKTAAITIAKGTPLSEATAALLLAGFQPETVESLSNPAAIAKAKHSLRHAESGQFVSGSPPETNTGSGGATSQTQSNAPPLTPDPRSTFPSEDMHDSLPGSAKPKVDYVVPEQGGGNTLWSHGGAVVPLLAKLRRRVPSRYNDDGTLANPDANQSQQFDGGIGSQL